MDALRLAELQLAQATKIRTQREKLREPLKHWRCLITMTKTSLAKFSYF
jgi:hypothetical protein